MKTKLISALFVLLTLIGGAAALLAARQPAHTDVLVLPCASLAAYVADLTTVRTGNTGGLGKRTRNELVFAQDALKNCIEEQGPRPSY